MAPLGCLVWPISGLLCAFFNPIGGAKSWLDAVSAPNDPDWTTNEPNLEDTPKIYLPEEAGGRRQTWLTGQPRCRSAPTNTKYNCSSPTMIEDEQDERRLLRANKQTNTRRLLVNTRPFLDDRRRTGLQPPERDRSGGRLRPWQCLAVPDSLWPSLAAPTRHCLLLSCVQCLRPPAGLRSKLNFCRRLFAHNQTIEGERSNVTRRTDS